VFAKAKTFSSESLSVVLKWLMASIGISPDRPNRSSAFRFHGIVLANACPLHAETQEGLIVTSRVSRRAFEGSSGAGVGEVSADVAAMNIAVSQARSVKTSRNVEGVAAAVIGAGS
jgi:hypothetical protein